MAEKKDKKDKKDQKKDKKDQKEDRKPKDYDEEDVPKVLKGPVVPDKPKDYDAPIIIRGPLMDMAGPHGRGKGPGMGMGPCMQRMLICPTCGQRAPFGFDELPSEVPISKLAAMCHQCGEKVKIGDIGLTKEGDYSFMG